jgi:hypothetical protein
MSMSDLVIHIQNQLHVNQSTNVNLELPIVIVFDCDRKVYTNYKPNSDETTSKSLTESSVTFEVMDQIETCIDKCFKQSQNHQLSEIKKGKNLSGINFETVWFFYS